MEVEDYVSRVFCFPTNPIRQPISFIQNTLPLILALRIHLYMIVFLYTYSSLDF